ncbi:MAG: DEAD/DEAH box helicase [Anaerolineales bacterium]|nr:DEAD/DEAH box helicase [Anaerolineales bacterium]
MITEFNQLNLHPQLIQAVSEQGFTTPTPIQSEVIPLMLAGQDVIGQAQTGTGKTAAFALPMLQSLQPGQKHAQGLVVAPTRELALQVAKAIAGYGCHSNVRVLAVYGGQAYGPQIGQLRRGVDIVVGTPGRLMDLMKRDVLELSGIHTVVLDEADEMLSMGFVDDIESILSKTPTERQTALFSATLPKEIRRLAERYMREPQPVTIQREQITVEAIEQRYYLVNAHDKAAALTRLFEVEEVTSALIFVRTRAETSNLAAELSSRGFPAEALSGDLAQDARERTLNRFRQNQIQVLVATDVAARGLDIDDISHVFNFTLPDDPEIYVHRIGRTGRAGKSGIAISLVSPGERRRLSNVEAFMRKKIQRAALPTEECIRNIREEKLTNKVAVWLRRGRIQKERELVEKMVAEGYDLLDIASAALKVARSEEKQRPIYAISEVSDYRTRSASRTSERGITRSRSRRESHSRDARSGNSHEPGMVRLQLNMGKEHGICPNEIVGVIASRADIPGSVIGKIRIQSNRSFVDVPEDMVSQVLAGTQNARIHHQSLDLQVA